MSAEKIPTGQKYRHVEVLVHPLNVRGTVSRRISVIELYKLLTSSHQIMFQYKNIYTCEKCTFSTNGEIIETDISRLLNNTDAHGMILFAANFAESAVDINRGEAKISLDEFIDLPAIDNPESNGTSDNNIGGFGLGQAFLTKIKRNSPRDIVESELKIRPKKIEPPKLSASQLHAIWMQRIFGE